MKRGFGGLNTGSNNRDARPEEKVRAAKFTKDFTAYRLVGNVFGYCQRWIEIETKKGVISIPKVALNYDADTDTLDDTVEDPYEKVPNPQRVQKVYWVNGINRDLQDSLPPHRKVLKSYSSTEKKKGVMDSLKSKAITPMEALRVTPQVATMLGNLMQMNKHKVKGKTVECEVSDPEFGCDIFISYDEKATPKYQVQKGDHSPLKDEEKEYLLWKIDDLMAPEKLEQARKEAEALSSKCPVDADTEEDEDDEDDALSKKKKKKKDKEKSSKEKDSGSRFKKRDKDAKSNKSERGTKERTKRRGI